MAKRERDPRLALIGKRIFERRGELEMTQLELAKSAGISKSFLSEVEGGQAAASGLNFLGIAEALDVSVEWLLSGSKTETTVAENVQPLPIVSRLGEEQNWPYRLVLDVNAALQAVVARRTRAGHEWRPTREYVLSVAEALKALEPGGSRGGKD